MKCPGRNCRGTLTDARRYWWCDRCCTTYGPSTEPPKTKIDPKINQLKDYNDTELEEELRRRHEARRWAYKDERSTVVKPNAASNAYMVPKRYRNVINPWMDPSEIINAIAYLNRLRADVPDDAEWAAIIRSDGPDREWPAVGETLALQE